MRFDGFIGETYQARSANANAERCVNLFPEITGGSGKSKIHYLHTPGLAEYITLPDGPVRCLWAGDEKMYVVSGTVYGEIKYGGGIPTFENRGSVANDGRKAYIYSNATETGVGGQLIIVSGGSLYCDIGGVADGHNAHVQAATDSGFVSSATYLDGYFIALERDSNAVYISALLDGTSWPALDKQARLSSPDRLVAIAADKKLLWMFGKRNIDVWYNSRNADFPFEPVQGGGIRCGTVLPDTLEDLDNSFFFAAENERGGVSVLRTEGSNLKRISTHAVEVGISGTLSANAFRSWTYETDGHQFYVLTTDVIGQLYSKTFVYDVTTGLWHERAYWNGSSFDPHLAQCHVYTNPAYSGGINYHFVGSRLNGKVYRQSMDLYTDAGGAIRRYRQAPHLSDGQSWSFYHELELDMSIEALAGTPAITLKWSDDDGATWTADKVPVLTASSDAKKRVIWRRLGRSRDRIFAVTLHGINAPVSINDAFLELTKGTGA